MASGFAPNIALLGRKVEPNWEKLLRSLPNILLSYGSAKVKSLIGDELELIYEVAKEVNLGELFDLANQPPDELFKVMVQRSITMAVAKLLSEQYAEININFENIETILSEKLLESLKTTPSEIEADVFDEPTQIPGYAAFKEVLAVWMTQVWGINKTQANNLTTRLDSYFVEALWQDWVKNHSQYSTLAEGVRDNPWTHAQTLELQWKRYAARLARSLDEPMFGETFSVKQLYMPLRAYKAEKITVDSPYSREKEQREKRTVFWLEEELESWLQTRNRNDAFRVISAGPGAGKSTVVRMFADKCLAQGQKVVFIPISALTPEQGAQTAIADYLKYSVGLEADLREVCAAQPVLLILDGADELTIHGGGVREATNTFVTQVRSLQNQINSDTCKLHVLLTGRELLIQDMLGFEPSQLLHLLPYHIANEEKNLNGSRGRFYFDGDEEEVLSLLNRDDREGWWRKYARLRGFHETELPEVLSEVEQLAELSAQPLLLYLITGSYINKDVEFDQTTNLNQVYRSLIKRVYHRNKDKRLAADPQPADEGLYLRFLARVGTAIWYNQGRWATAEDIRKTLQGDKELESLLDRFEDENQGISRLLTNFYFRKSSHGSSLAAFEFSHKSFGEYLTARRFVEAMFSIDEDMRLEKRPLGIEEALDEWAIVAGVREMDFYVLEFLRNEVRTVTDTEKVLQTQETFATLLRQAIEVGSSMASPKLPQTYLEKRKWARNAEESLLVAHSACAQTTDKVSDILSKNQDGSPVDRKAFGTWLHWIRGQSPKESCALRSLERIRLQQQALSFQDLIRANLMGVNLAGANLMGVNLVGANLAGANLAGAYLVGAYLRRAYLRRANLMGAELRIAELEEANLEGANLWRVNLEGANLMGANLMGANLMGANLMGANLMGAYLMGAYWLNGQTVVEGKLEKSVWTLEDGTTLDLSKPLP